MKCYLTVILYFVLATSFSIAQNKPGSYSFELKIPEIHEAMIRNDECEESPNIDSLKKEMFKNLRPRSTGEFSSELIFYSDEENTKKVSGTVHTLISTLGDGFVNYCTVTEQTGPNSGRIWVIATVIVGSPTTNDLLEVFKFEQGIWSLYVSLYVPYFSNGDDIDAELIEGGPDGPILWVVAEYHDNVGLPTKIRLLALNLNQPSGATQDLFWPGAGPQDIYHSPRITSDNVIHQNYPTLYIVASLDSSVASGLHLYAQKYAYIDFANSISNYLLKFRNSILPIYWPEGGTTQNHQLYSEIAYVNPPTSEPKLVFTYSGVPDRTRIWLSTCSVLGTNAQAMGTIDGTGDYNIDVSAIASPGGDGQNQLMVVAREDYLNSGDLDIISYKSDDGGTTWNFSYVEAYSSTADFLPQLGTLISRRNTLNEYYLSYGLGDGAWPPDSIVAINSKIGTTDFWNSPVTMSIGTPNSYHSAIGITTTPGELLTVWEEYVVNAFAIWGSFYPSIPSSVFDDENNSIASYKLLQNYPNPFNPSTKITYQLNKGAFVSIKVYDVLGNEITTLLYEEKPAGEHVINFNAAGLSSGVYYYRLVLDGYSETKKMVVLK